MVEFQTGRVTFSGETLDEVTKQVLEYNVKQNARRKHKPFPTDYGKVYRLVHKANQTSEQREKNRQLSEDRRKLKTKSGKQLTFHEAMSGASAIIKLAVGSIVETAEMSRRAAICGRCPLTDKNSGCTGCTAGAAVSNAIDNIKRLAGRGIKYPAIPGHGRAKNYYCGHCGCSMLTMLPAKMDCFKEEEADNQLRPDYCWVRTDSENYKP